MKEDVISTKTLIIGISEINKKENANKFLRGGIPIAINCVPLLVYLFSCRFRNVDDDFVFNKTCYSNHCTLNIYYQVYSKLNILLILKVLPCTYKWKMGTHIS